MGDGALGRQAALDQPGRRQRQRLGDALLAGSASIFRAHRDDHPKLRRHDVQALAPVLADPHHLPAAAGAERALWLDHLLDALQMLRQMADIALGPLRRARRRRIAGRGLRLHFRTRALQLLEGQLALVRRQLLRPSCRERRTGTDGGEGDSGPECRRHGGPGHVLCRGEPGLGRVLAADRRPRGAGREARDLVEDLGRGAQGDRRGS